MAGFLYFLPRSEPSAPSLDAIAAAGLGYAFDTQPEAVTCRMNSPCGLGPGFVLGDQSRMGDYSVKYAPAEQEWRKLPCGCVVGWYRDAPPGPDDLARDEQLPGYSLTMGDGRQWCWPLVRSVDDLGDPVCLLPSVLVRDPESRRLKPGPPLQRYRRIWEETEWVWQALVSGDNTDHELRALETCGVLLGQNYRVSEEEIDLLTLYTSLLRPEGLAGLCVGSQQFTELQESKKKAAT